jgi:hypothetical protein
MFKRVAQHLIDKGVLTRYMAGVWFIHRLPEWATKKLIKKYNADAKDPTTIIFDNFVKHIESIATADRALGRITASQSFKAPLAEFEDLLKRF